MCHCALLIVIISNYMSVCFTRGIYTSVSSYITSNSRASVPEASHKYFKHESSSGQIKGQTYSIPVVCFRINVISGRVVFMTTLLSQCKSASSPRHWEDKVCPEQLWRAPHILELTLGINACSWICRRVWPMYKPSLVNVEGERSLLNTRIQGWQEHIIPSGNTVDTSISHRQVTQLTWTHLPLRHTVDTNISHLWDKAHW